MEYLIAVRDLLYLFSLRRNSSHELSINLPFASVFFYDRINKMTKKKSLKNIFSFKGKKLTKAGFCKYCKNAVKGGNLYLLIFVIVFLGIFLFLKNWFIVATVNYQPITRFTINRELEKQLGEQILDNQITEVLIQQEAKRKNVKVTSEEIQEKVKEIEDQLAAQSQNLDNILATQKQTRKDLEEDLRNQIIIEKLVSESIEVSDQEIETFFEENKTYFEEGTTLEDNKEKVKEVLLQEKMGNKFQSWIDNLKENAKINHFVTF